jgi:hypothetical protein
MKKLIFIFMTLVIAFSASAQTKVGSYKALAGTAADTLTASATKSYIGEWASYDKELHGSVHIWSDLVSGTATYTAKIWESNDGVNWPATATDSVSKSHASDFNHLFDLATVKGRYFKVSWIATAATQKSTLYIYARSARKD